VTSIVLDSMIFGCFIWGLVYLKNHKNCGDAKLLLAAKILILLVLIRILHIFLLILYIFFVLPCYYMPDCCIFKKMLMKTTVDKEIIEEIES